MRGHITEKELKCFRYEFKNVIYFSRNLEKLYLLPKIYKSLVNVPCRSLISNCGTPTEKVPEILDYHLKSVMQSGKSYIKDSRHNFGKNKDFRMYT